MEVSQGFAKKIEGWLSDYFSYKPFESNSNPYKTRFMIVNSNAAPRLVVDHENITFFINSLVNEEFMKDFFFEHLEELPKEYKGAKKLVKWLRENCDVEPMMSPINAYMTNTLAELKHVEATEPAMFQRGTDIFEDVLREFTNVDTLLLHGTYAVEQFRKRFKDALTIVNEEHTSIKVIEENGLFAKLQLDGREIDVYVCRSLSTFTANSAAFEVLRGHLKKALS